MENVDIFNAATAPLTFHDFLERMRHPSAADLVRSIKSFIVSFSCNAADPERDSKNVQEFVCSMEEAFKAHPLWAGATEEELDSAGEGLEKYLMTKLFNRAFASLPEDVKRDQEISEKMSLVQQFIRPEHLEILPNFQNETSWLKVSAWKKFHVIYAFFFVRKIVAHIVTFTFYCAIIPATVFVPEIQLPKWGAVYIPSIITILNALSTPKSLHLLVFWILFENVMSLHRTKATIIGLLEAGRVNV